MPRMPFLGLFIMILCLFTLLRNRASRSQQETTERFWEREARANNTRLQDLSGLPYITIPFSDFPIGIYENELLKKYEAELQKLSDKKILNLNGQTNTDLKLTYGTASIPILTEYEQNFTALCHILVKYASQLFDLGYVADARTVLEYGIDIGSDFTKNYLLLAEIYQANHETERLRALISSAQALHSLMKTSLIEKLNDMLE